MVLNEIVFFALFIFVWLFTVTVILYRSLSHYNRLTGGENTKRLKDVLNTILSKQEAQEKKIELQERDIRYLEKQGKLHFSKIGISRYNPFSDTGGSQSFSMALLDGSGNGIAITSLYARTGNRWLVKEIENKTGKGIELSKEEMVAIRRAETKNT